MITIVVLLILAGVSINMVLGQNGIVTKAQEARDKTEHAKQNDLASMDQVVKDMDDILNDSESPSVDWDEILKKAEENPDQFRDKEQQSSNKDIGIGTDGKAVNLDRWYYETDPYNGVATLRGTQGNGWGNPGYVGKIENGRIIGKVPQYIKKDGEDAWCEVQDLTNTFCYWNGLVIAPEIPSGATNMSSTFYGCTSLTTAPKIPEGVTDMNRTFEACKGLTIAPEIPEGVRNMALTFEGCVNLTTAPTIPSSVTNIAGTFYSCKKLTGDIVINAKQLTANSGSGYYLDNNGYTECFFGTELPITLKGTSPYLEMIAADYRNVTVAQ